MFLVVNSFTFNGGSTFVIRLAREYARRGKKIGVLILVDNIDQELKQQLEQVADVYMYKEFIRKPFKWTDGSQLGMFAPAMFTKLKVLIQDYGNHIHVMGVFGLLFVARLIKKSGFNFGVSAGIYHQYEYMFHSTSLLARHTQNVFKSLGVKGAVFLNEANKESYSRFFNLDYADAPLVPVGIELPEENNVKGSAVSYRIVSIGNLHPFKTYNLHIINLMPELLKLNKNFTYEIYGEGELEAEAKGLIQKLELENKVFLKGSIPYRQFSDVMNDAFLFVGSGTAIVEASALGVPSVIGIESSKSPVTYGYLSGILGFSYNELNEFQQTVSMYDVIEKITLDVDFWEKISKDCSYKASQFAITHTVDGFEKVEAGGSHIGTTELIKYSNLRLLFSFFILGLKQVLRLDTGFSRRRNRVE